jgi:hypothetical protein
MGNNDPVFVTFVYSVFLLILLGGWTLETLLTYQLAINDDGKLVIERRDQNEPGL